VSIFSWLQYLLGTKKRNTLEYAKTPPNPDDASGPGTRIDLKTIQFLEQTRDENNYLDGHRRLFANTTATLTDYVVLVILNLLATPLLITHFGIDGYGAFVFLSIFSIYGALSFFDLGMEGSIMNFVARMMEKEDRQGLHGILTISLAYYALVGFLVGVAIYLAGGFIADRLLDSNTALQKNVILNAIAVIAAMVVVQFLAIPFTAVLQGMRRFVVTKGINIVINILRYGLVVLIAVLTGRIDYAFMIILGLTVVRLLALVSIFVFGLPEYRSMRFRFDPSLLRKLLSFTSVLFIYRLIGLIHNQIDKVLIWLYLAVGSMAIYDVVVRPANIMRLALTVLNSAVIPEVARLHEENDYTAIKNLYIRLIRFAYLTLLPAVAVLCVFIDILLRLWVGGRFVPYSYMSIIILSVYLFLPVSSVASTMVVGLERIRQTIWIPITATVINIALSIILLRLMGLVGLLIATLAANMVSSVPYFFFMRRTLRFGISEIVKPTAGIFGLAAVAAIAYAAVRFVLTGMPYIQIPAIAVVFALNCIINYRYLLTDGEKTFFKEIVLRRNSE